MTNASHTRHFEKLVKHFAEVFEVAAYGHPDKAPFQVHKLRARLIEEETAEYYAARTDEDILDAICDIIYVVAGTAVTYSIPVADYTSKVLRGTDPLPSIAQACRLVTNDLYTLFPCPRMLAAGINKSLAVLCDVAAIKGYSLLPAFVVVHLNNMDKLWNELPPAERKLKATPKGPGKWLVTDAGGKIIKPPYHVKVDLKPYIL